MAQFIILLLIITILTLYLFLIKPNSARIGEMLPFEETLIAHRGFHDNAGAAPENSLAAFRLACEEGYGIELDVQMTTDGALVVFHDASLFRMTGENGCLVDRSLIELSELRLAGTTERIPLFAEVLRLVDGRVPLIVEIKSEGNWRETARKTAEILDSYRGTYCIESFHPGVVLWFKKNRPDVIRGQLASDFTREDDDLSPLKKFVLSNLLANAFTKPDFIAYNHHFRDQFSYTLCRRLYKCVNVAWTIRSQQELYAARDTFSVFIFDSFIPK